MALRVWEIIFSEIEIGSCREEIIPYIIWKIKRRKRSKYVENTSVYGKEDAVIDCKNKLNWELIIQEFDQMRIIL